MEQQTVISSRWWWLAILLIGLILGNWYFFLPEDPFLTMDVFQLSQFSVLERNTLYLWLNFLTILGPFILSFDSKVAYWRSWKYLFPAIILTMLVFIPWDILFTKVQVWGFNPDYYVESLKLFGLPPGEWLFFITVPYSCVFIYACLRTYLKKDLLKPVEGLISNVLIILFTILAIFYWGNLYSSTTFLLSIFLIALHRYVWKSDYLSWYYLAYLVSLVPFVIVNGILTGGLTKKPVVIYNDLENLGLRLGSIPLDDLAYCFLLLLMCVSWFEYFRKSGSVQSS